MEEHVPYLAAVRDNPLTLAKVIEWANTKRPDQYIGTSGDPTTCPVTLCVIELYKIPIDVRVSISWCTNSRKWDYALGKFVLLIDKYELFVGPYMNNKVVLDLSISPLITAIDKVRGTRMITASFIQEWK